MSSTPDPAKRYAVPSRSVNLMRFGLSPHTPYTVSAAVLKRLNSLSKQKKIHFAMHVAESRDETGLMQRKRNGLTKLYEFANWNIDQAPRGISPIQYLHRIGFLSPALLAIHVVHASDADIRILRRSNVAVGHCPRSNHETHAGIMPLKKMLNAGITVGLGTDSTASSPNLSMWDEMRYALKVHQKDGITAQNILHIATMGGAHALGMGHMIGSLESGKQADIIAVPLPSRKNDDLFSSLLRETKNCIMTMVSGKMLFRDDTWVKS